MTIIISEDDAPDGCVSVDYDISGFDIETAREDGDLPAALLLGGRLLQVVDEELPSVGGRPAPPPRGHLPTRTRRK